MGTAARRPLLIGPALAVLALGGAVLALRLEPEAGTGTLVAKDTPSFEATERLHRDFGDDAVYVLIRGSVPRLVLTADLGRLVGLEGCLSGNAPRGARMPGGRAGPCARLARLRPAQVVFGPGT